jgi:signal peptidase I
MHAPDEQGQGSFFKDILKFGLIALVIVIPIRLYIAQPFIVSGASMHPTFDSGEYLIVDQLTYQFIEEPERGEVIVFRFPRDPSKYFIKRVVGLPGETIELREDKVLVSNEEHPDGFKLDEPYVDPETTYRSMTVELDAGEYFVLGDNRQASADSRTWGPLNSELIIGRAFLRLLPLNETGVLPGNYDMQ